MRKCLENNIILISYKTAKTRSPDLANGFRCCYSYLKGMRVKYCTIFRAYFYEGGDSDKLFINYLILSIRDKCV